MLSAAFGPDICFVPERDGDQAAVGVVLHQLGLASGVRFAGRFTPRIKANLRERGGGRRPGTQHYRTGRFAAVPDRL